jgi:hypothetical protein
MHPNDYEDGYEAGKAKMLSPLTDQEAALKLANLISVWGNDALRAEAIVEKRIEVMSILARVQS